MWPIKEPITDAPGWLNTIEHPLDSPFQKLKKKNVATIFRNVFIYVLILKAVCGWQPTCLTPDKVGLSAKSSLINLYVQKLKNLLHKKRLSLKQPFK